MAVKRLFAILALSVSAACLFAAPAELRVKGDRVNLRARPVGDSEVAGQVSTGDILVAPEGFQPGAEWVKVRPPASVDVWIYASLLTADEVNASDCLVRSGPGLNYRYVGKLDKGDKIVRRGNQVGDWQPIAPIADKCELFISSEYVEAVLPPEPAATPAPPPAPEQVAKPVAAPPPAPAPDQVAKAEPPPPPTPVTPPAPAAVADKEMPVAQVADKPAVPPPRPPVPPAEVKPLVPPPAPAPAVQVSKPVTPPTPAPVPAPAPAPSKPSPQPRVSAPIRLPPELCNLALDNLQPQGTAVVYSGRLEKISSVRTSGPARYQLVAKTGTMKSSVICRLSGLTGQWRELVDSDLEVSGSLWYLSGDPVPVLYASRVVRVASWEE